MLFEPTRYICGRNLTVKAFIRIPNLAPVINRYLKIDLSTLKSLSYCGIYIRLP